MRLAIAVALAGCGGGDWLTDAHIIVDGAHAMAIDCTTDAGVAPIDGDRFLVTWYSTPLDHDDAWISAIFGPTDIWQATLDLSQL